MKYNHAQLGVLGALLANERDMKLKILQGAELREQLRSVAQGTDLVERAEYVCFGSLKYGFAKYLRVERKVLRDVKALKRKNARAEL